MIFSPYIKQLLERHLGKAIHRPADCEMLALDIESVTGQHIGVNTIKRLLGFKRDEREPRLTTLDIIARYLDFDNWDTLKELDSKSNSDFGISPDGLQASDIPIGQTVSFSYLPNRHVTLRRLHDDLFEVAVSENGKLEVGDIVRVSNFMLHYPLPVASVLRNGEDFGSLLLGKVSGLTSVCVGDDSSCK